jgi:hypothetical protein
LTGRGKESRSQVKIQCKRRPDTIDELIWLEKKVSAGISGHIKWTKIDTSTLLNVLRVLILQLLVSLAVSHSRHTYASEHIYFSLAHAGLSYMPSKRSIKSWRYLGSGYFGQKVESSILLCIPTMPSFTRRIPSTAPPPLPALIKTGVPSLDDLLHLPPSSTSVVFSPDVHSSWPRLIARYFTAQAFLGSENILVVGEGGSSRELVKGCMWVDERANGGGGKGAEESGSEGEMDKEGDNRSKIAWRYGGMEKFKTSIGRSLILSSDGVTLYVLTARALIE